MAATNYAVRLAALPLDCDAGGGKEDMESFSSAAPRWFAYQHRAELVLLCEWIEKKAIRSYLELGFYRGGLLSALHELFRFEKVAGVDPWVIQRERGLVVSLPDDAKICVTRSEHADYRKFRHELGKIDLVFIDGDHSYGSVRADYEREKKQPHRFLAFHDIKNTHHAPGVVRFWNELGGKKRELYVPRTVLEMRMVTNGDEMGIGIWSQKETP